MHWMMPQNGCGHNSVGNKGWNDDWVCAHQSHHYEEVVWVVSRQPGKILQVSSPELCLGLASRHSGSLLRTYLLLSWGLTKLTGTIV